MGVRMVGMSNWVAYAPFEFVGNGVASVTAPDSAGVLSGRVVGWPARTSNAPGIGTGNPVCAACWSRAAVSSA
jgi:hypothetical protein